MRTAQSARIAADSARRLAPPRRSPSRPACRAEPAPASTSTASRSSTSSACTALEVNNIDRALRPSTEPFIAPQLAELKAASQNAWDIALALGEQDGYRNSQVTVLAPTGTIGFMMDCDTTGIEPDLALVKYKKLVGGGMIQKIVNNTVPGALFQARLQDLSEVEGIVNYIDATGTIEGAPALAPEHLAVFDCSFKPAKGTAYDFVAGPRQDDGGGTAVLVRSHFEDRQPSPTTAPCRTSPTPTPKAGSSASRLSPFTATAPRARSR